MKRNSLTYSQKNKDKTILENLRPISLLNVDYKILTKVLAICLEKVLPKIINPDQTSYVKGRYIGENIRLIQDLMFYLEKVNSPGIAVFVDFWKAFDTIEWNYLEKPLKLFPAWKLMPPKLKRCGLASGKTDVTLHLISVGQFDPICALGIFFSHNVTKATKLNFDEMPSMENILNIWKNRKLTLIDRINIVKTLALSKLIFNSSNLSSLNYLSGAVNNMIFNFIWQHKPPKIKKATIISEKNKGGLKVIDFQTMETVLKIAWVNRLRQNCHSSWKILIEH